MSAGGWERSRRDGGTEGRRELIYGISGWAQANGSNLQDTVMVLTESQYHGIRLFVFKEQAINLFLTQMLNDNILIVRFKGMGFHL